MEILRENFEEQLPKILESIEEADFIAYDYEFTGLFDEKDRGLVDSPSDRYQRLRKQCVKFLPIQCGLCTFKYNESQKSYTYQTFSVYLFPHSLEFMSLSDKCYLLQSSSIDFLVKHGFDFNKAFYHGVGFVSAVDTEERKNKLDKRYEALCEDLAENQTPKAVMTVPKNMEAFMSEKTKLVQEFIDKKPSSDEDIRFYKLNSYQRKLLYNHLPKLSDSLMIESEHTLKDGSCLVIKMRPNGPRNLQKEYEEKRDKMKKLADTQSGFSLVVDSISKSKAIIIGHNQSIDLLHNLHHFNAPLPETYEEFKEFVTVTFPRLIDTKFMASCEPLKDHIPDTHLSALYETTGAEPFKVIKLETDKELTDENFHDAAYDAFCTGRIFLSTMEFLVEQKKMDFSLENANKVLKPFFHKIPIMDSLTFRSWNLGGNDEIPDPIPVYHTTFPPRWRIEDIKKAFEPALSESKAMRVYWIDQQSAWVKIFDDHVPEKVENLSNVEVPFNVQSLATLRVAKQEANETPRPKKRRISGKTNDGDHTPVQRKSFTVPEEW